MPSQLDPHFGAFLIGSWVNVMLYMLELYEIRMYFKHYTDPLAIRCAVVTALLFDTICTVASCASVYLYVIVHWGDVSYLGDQYWPIPLYVAATGFTAIVVQLFLIYRIFRVSRNYLISIALAVIAITALAGSVADSIFIIRFPRFVDRSRMLIPSTIWVTSSAAADIAIAVVFIVILRNKKPVFKSTKSLILHLMWNAIRTGSVTAALAIIVMGVCLADPKTLVAVGFCFIIGRVYTLSMMFNLNARKSGRHSGNTSEETRVNPRQAPINLTSIQVSRSIHVETSSVAPTDVRRNRGLSADVKPFDDDTLEAGYAVDKPAPFSAV